MKYKLGAIMGIMFLLMSSALGCHWYCFGTMSTDVATSSNANSFKPAGTSLTFAPQDPTATYKWWVYDENGLPYPYTTSASGAIGVTLPQACGKAITVSYTASIAHTGLALPCIQSNCYKIWTTCPSFTCPTAVDYCFGNDPASIPIVTDPSPSPVPAYVYTWSYKVHGATSWSPAGVGYSPTLTWNTLGSATADTTYDLQVVATYPGTTPSTTVKTCPEPGTTLDFVVFRTPSGGVNVSP